MLNPLILSQPDLYLLCIPSYTCHVHGVLAAESHTCMHDTRLTVRLQSPFVEMMLKGRGSNSGGSDQLWRSFVVREGGLTVTPWPGQQSWSVMYSGEPKLEMDVLSYDLTARWVRCVCV